MDLQAFKALGVSAAPPVSAAPMDLSEGRDPFFYRQGFDLVRKAETAAQSLLKGVMRAGSVGALRTALGLLVW